MDSGERDLAAADVALKIGLAVVYEVGSETYVRRSGVWVKADAVQIRRSGVWSDVGPDVYVRRGGAWAKA